MIQVEFMPYVQWLIAGIGFLCFGAGAYFTAKAIEVLFS